MSRTAVQVLHILPHAGGGVGAVLRALLRAETASRSLHSHRVASLETLNAQTQACLDTLGIASLSCADDAMLAAWVAAADVVVLHWWNHPLLMRLLTRGLAPSRLILWSHVNGYAVPQAFFPELFIAADMVAFASEASLDAPVVRGLSPDARTKLRVIRSCAGVPAGAEKPTPKTPPFRFGYLGTVEPAKMHPAFLTLCAEAGLDTPCLVAGGNGHDNLLRQACQAALADRFEIFGPVADPKTIMQRLHVFAYPLAPGHYGTGEQVLVEAMAYGCVPVVLDNPPERALIRHGVTGLVARTGEEFSAFVRLLANDSGLRRTLAAGGHAFVMDHCPIERSQQAFGELFEELLERAKMPHRVDLAPVDGIRPESPFHLFLAACGQAEEGSMALAIAQGKTVAAVPSFFSYATRGAPAHYLRFLGDDVHLARLCAVACPQGDTHAFRPRP